MKYALLICTDQSVRMTADEAAAEGRAVGAWDREMTDRGVLVQAQRLAMASDARSVHVHDDEVLLADGPFAETKEQIAGFVVIECANLDEAIAVAASSPLAKTGTIAVRAFWPD
ncbi:YciI family protein [Amycolatopsis sp. H20-H5]|uniref:YciI family protein n=1 Tax=Amycolatopsis sp. H20-H5 TaxID=3046309 RepID=UPI002DB58CB2|nr:YciI family protein [Amycolatopsis sp. H20-H5]MEC3978284.1 YciI family protein [Amycolatopsis sp. H20-H5]